jgi:DNA-binding GntR family transcriptional regulator
VLHVTFGAVLTDDAVAERIAACLDRDAESYAAALERHLGRHLDALAAA